jgi:hypothetical protein
MLALRTPNVKLKVTVRGLGGPAQAIKPLLDNVGVTPEPLDKLPKFVIDHSVGEPVAAN